MAQDLIEKIRAAAQAKGIDPEVALGIARAESNLDPNAKNKSSSASGLFQIINNTWAGNKGTPGKQFDPDENIRVGTDIISKNVQSLKGFLGRDPSPKEVYAAHYFGASGAQDFLSAAPDTPTSKIFSEKVLKANPNLKNKTAGEVLSQLEGKLKVRTSNVSRETTAKKEPLPASLPPMAEATQARTTTVAKLDMANMPASYKAAFALAALADAKDDEDDKAYNEDKETESEKLMREYKPVNHLASLDLEVKPVMFNEGGEVDAEDKKRPDDINYFANPNRMKDRGVTTDSVMLGASKKAGDGSVMAGLNMANMSKDEKMQTARALMLAYTQQDPEGLGINANVIKPLNPKGPAMANLLGSIPVGEGRVSAGLHGGKAFSLGYNQPIEGGQFDANLVVPRGTMGSPQLNMRYEKRFADGGDVSARQDEPFFDAASRTYVDVLTGRRTPITEKDFTAKEQLAMMDAVKKSLARGGKGRVDYQDYPTGDQIGPGFVDIRNTLGGFQYKQNPDGSTVITDRYDFHGPRAKEYEKMGTGEKLVKSAANALSAFVKSGGGVRDAAGEIGDAWIGKSGPQVNIRIPVNRAKGGDAEPTAEEIAAASTPAFIAQKSGIGRKEGNISKALKSGEGYVEFAKGLTNVPQNIVGAPMDISNMIANVYGGGVEKPFMGSEYLKEKSRAAGLGFTPSTDPTLAGFYGAGDLGSNLVNPAGATRAGVKAAGKTGEAAKMLARDFQGYNQQLEVPGASYAIRNKGTPFIMTPERTTLYGQVVPEMNEADAYADKMARIVDTGSGRRTDNPALANWFRSKVGAYLRRDFGTEQDQMVQAADKGQKMHFMSPKFLEEGMYPLTSQDIRISRELESFPKSGYATTAKGQEAETLVDSSIYPLQLQDISENRIPSNMRQFIDTNPEMRLSEMGPVDENLKFEVLADEMNKMFNEKVFRAYGEQVPMPKEYVLTEKTLEGLTPAQASNRVALKQEWTTKKQAELAGVAIVKDPQIVSHSYDNGSKWISPADLADNARHEEMVKDIGCAGGWCTRSSNYALDYGSGDNRLNILLDKKFEPRVQLTLNNPTPTLDDFATYMSEMGSNSVAVFKMRTYSGVDENVIAELKAMPEWQDFVKQNQGTKHITEIKGKLSTSDLTNSPYLKEVQDFVKRQGPELQTVDNLNGINMTDLRNVLLNMNRPFDQNYMNRLLKTNGGSYFVDKDEASSLIKKVDEMPNNAARQIQMNMFQPPAERAHGGMIERQPTDNRRYL